MEELQRQLVQMIPLPVMAFLLFTLVRHYMVEISSKFNKVDSLNESIRDLRVEIHGLVSQSDHDQSQALQNLELAALRERIVIVETKLKDWSTQRKRTTE